MKKIILIIVCQLFFIGIYAQAFQWALQGGGAGSNSTSDMGEAVTTDTQGNVIFTGLFEGTALFGTTSLTSAGSNDVFVAKYASDGTFLWAVKAGGTQLDWGKAICTDKNNNIYITGQFSGTATFGTSTTLTASSTDIFVAKYNSSGVLQWAKKEGGSSVDRGLAIATDTIGNVIVTGDFSGSMTVGPTNLISAGAADVFVVKYNSQGTVKWAKKAGNIVNDRATAITTDNSGNLYIAGSFGGTVSFGSTQLTATGGSSDTDIFTAKLDSAGTFVWAKKGGSNAAVVEEARGIATDGSANVYVTGLFGGSASFDGTSIISQGSSDAFLVKYNNSGMVQWARSGGGLTEEEGTAVTVLPNGSVCITGFYKGSAVFGTTTLSAFGGTADFDAFMVKYAANGNMLWARSFGRTNEDKAAGIKSDFQNNVYVTGYFRNNILFDQLQLNAQGYSDAFLAQINDFVVIDTLSTLTYCAGDIIPLVYNTSITFNSSNVFTAWLSDALGSFANATNIGTLGATTSDTIWAALPYSLTAGTSYKIKIEASDQPAFSAPSFFSLTINEAPAKPQAASSTDLCLGDTLHIIEVTGQTVYWYADSTLNSVIYSGNTLSVNQVLLEDSVFYCVAEGTNGCYSQVAEITVSVHPYPVITNNLADTNNLCINAQPFLMSLIPAGGTFSGAGVVSGTDNFIPSLAQAGFHTINYAFLDSFACASNYELYFDVLPTPLVSIDTASTISMTDGDTLVFHGTPQGGTFSGQGVTGNSFVGDSVLCNPCIISYVYQSLNGCSDTATITVTITNGIHHIDNMLNAVIFPNPVKDIINIQTNALKSEPVKVQLFDISSRLVLEKSYNTNDVIELNVESLIGGVYFLKISVNDKSYNRLIIKE